MPPAPLPDEPASTIYRLALDNLLSQGLHLIVDDSTASFTRQATDSSFFGPTPNGFEDAVADFYVKIKRSVPLPAIRPPHDRIIRMTDKETESLAEGSGRRLKDRFKCGMWPCAFFASLSAIGYAPDSTRAALYLGTWCSGLCGTHEMIYFVRSVSGQWMVHSRHVFGAN